MNRLPALLGDRRVLWAGVAAAAIAAFVFVFFVLPPLLVPSDVGATEAARVKLRNDVRSTATQFLGGLALVSGLFFTARTLRLNREGQLTDRFSRAIDQLGHDRLDVRLGGIYALERIALDSKRDHGPVMEVLTAFVRRYERVDWDPKSLRAPYEIQAIVTVLGRRERRHEAPDTRLDLIGADLRAARITGDLSGAQLRSADLGRAYVYANLAGARLRFARAGATFQGADLSGARAMQTDFTGALFLRDTRLDGLTYDRRTVWPKGFDPEAVGARLIKR